MIYFSSDTHFCHDQSFIYEPRGFSSVDEMNKAIVREFNHAVGPDDDLYLLGDFFLNDNKTGMYYFNQLPGRIHLVYGNHDSRVRQELVAEAHNVVEVCGYATVLEYNKYRFYLSHYPSICANYDQDKLLKAQTICLCGHTHTKDRFADMDKGLIYHVEVDAHDLKPVSVDEVISDVRSYLNKH